jgi:hypothetical protein
MERKKPEAAIAPPPQSGGAPSIREMVLPEPWPKKKPTAWIMAIRENTTPTAPVALLLCSRDGSRCPPCCRACEMSMLNRGDGEL